MSVTFDLTKNTTYQTELSCHGEAKIWYSSKDIKNFRLEAFQLVDAENDKAAGSFCCASAIRGTYQACCKVNVETQGRVLNDVQHDVLKEWLANSEHLIGLDKYIKCRGINRHRLHRESVMTVQAMDFDDHARPIRAESLEHSRAARLYARTMAQALFEAADVSEASAPVGLRSKIGKTLSRPLLIFSRNPMGGVAA
jgi:hypothetical protein